jgi:hypothetical protein
MTATVLILLIAACVLVYVRGPILAWRRYRGVRLVTCPESRKTAAVTVDVGHAAVTSLVDDRAEVRLEDCSRWPERGPCREPCLTQVHEGSQGTVAEFVEQWYSGHSCAYCGKPITTPTSTRHPPALRGPDGITMEWSDLKPESLPDLFNTHQPVCWNCHLAESFVRSHPELVVERPQVH